LLSEVMETKKLCHPPSGGWQSFLLRMITQKGSCDPLAGGEPNPGIPTEQKKPHALWRVVFCFSGPRDLACMEQV
jgi:hypothetical protein